MVEQLTSLFRVWAGAGSNLHFISGYSDRLYVPPLSHYRELVVRPSTFKCHNIHIKYFSIHQVVVMLQFACIYSRPMQFTVFVK